MSQLLGEFQAWLEQFYASLSYGRIFLLMAMESSLLPVPAELVLVPAGYMIRAGRFSFGGVVAVAACGSLVGATVNYLIASLLGRPFLRRYGKYLLIHAHRYEQAERLFLQNAGAATFFGRLLPVIRHLISLPAGVFKMPWHWFAWWTVFGAALMCTAEVALGYYLGEPAVALATRYSHLLGVAIVIAVPLAALGWFLWKRRG